MIVAGSVPRDGGPSGRLPVPEGGPDPSARASAHFVDTPPWPSPGTTPLALKLTWVVYPSRPESAPAIVDDVPNPARRRHVELVARIGAVARRLDLGAHTGALSPGNQSVCHAALPRDAISYAKQRGEVAKMAFFRAGAVGYVVRRGGDDVLEVVEWAEDDGVCPDGKGKETSAPSPAEERSLFTMNVPRGVPITEAMIEVQGPGKEIPFSCNE